MNRGYLPSTDAELMMWAANFGNLITATPETYGLTAEQAGGFADLAQSYGMALATATDPTTRTRPTIQAKNTARAAMKDEARLLVSIIQGQRNVTDAQKLELWITVRDTSPSPVPPPSESPTLKVLWVRGRRVRVKLEGQGPRQGRPTGVAGATVFTHIGAEPPAGVDGWQFATNTGQTVLTLDFESSTAADTVWLTAFWFNPRKESGPATQPISVNLPAATAAPTGATMKIAA